MTETEKGGLEGLKRLNPPEPPYLLSPPPLVLIKGTSNSSKYSKYSGKENEERG
jgi:hypothetical protein